MGEPLNMRPARAWDTDLFNRSHFHRSEDEHFLFALGLKDRYVNESIFLGVKCGLDGRKDLEQRLSNLLL